LTTPKHPTPVPFGTEDATPGREPQAAERSFGEAAPADASRAEATPSPGDSPGEEADLGPSSEGQLAAAEQAARDNYDRFLRTAAELENFRKRSARELSELRKYANQALVRDLLPIVDNLERAIEAARAGNASAHPLLEGVDMIRRDILKVFESNGVSPVDALGQPFDPTVHEAVMQEAVDGDVPDNTVVRELQRGYCMHERLLRPAMVVVAKKSD
jgi:molecular chaperone GrpE